MMMCLNSLHSQYVELSQFQFNQTINFILSILLLSLVLPLRFAANVKYKLIITYVFERQNQLTAILIFEIE